MCADISQYAHIKQYIQFLYEDITQLIFLNKILVFGGFLDQSRLQKTVFFTNIEKKVFFLTPIFKKITIYKKFGLQHVRFVFEKKK